MVAHVPAGPKSSGTPPALSSIPSWHPPASSCAAMARALRVLPLNTLLPRPKGQSLAMATASASESKGMTVMTCSS
jgi:hypothetical protein